MHFNVVTLFPEFFDSPLAAGLMAKAVERSVVSFGFTNPRDFAEDRHRTVDDRPYGGGPGMVMLLEPLARALESLPRPGRMLLLSPRGRRFDQAMARELALGEAVTLICGRYEGVDERLLSLFPIEPVSVGDMVLNGGEAGALCMVEAMARLVPGFMGKEESGAEESFSEGLLEYPHYTRPEAARGLAVPAELLGGDHARVARWRRDKALEMTLAHRPDLLDAAPLAERDVEHLRALPRERLGRNLHVALVHWPVLGKDGKVGAVSLTNLDIHDISRVSRSYGAAGLYLVTPLGDQRRLAETLLEHWVSGPGSRSNPDRAEALGLARVAESLEAARADVRERTGREPRMVVTSARMPDAPDAAGAGAALSLEQARGWLRDGPVLLVFGTGHGLAPQAMAAADGVLRPIRCLADYNHLPVRAAAAITLDRLLADHL